MSKAHDPHWRYVALHVEAERSISRRALQNAILGRARREGVEDANAPQLTRFAWPHAIVKVHHHALAAARAWLPRVDFAVEGGQKVAIQLETLSSSGTIKALTDRLRLLQERGEEKAAPGGQAKPSSTSPRGASPVKGRRRSPSASTDGTSHAAGQDKRPPAGGPAPPDRAGPARPARDGPARPVRDGPAPSQGGPAPTHGGPAPPPGRSRRVDRPHA